MTVPNLFRRRNGGDAGLPTTLGGGGASRSNGRFTAFQPRRSRHDGSARGIHVQAPVVQAWKKSTKATKTSYISLVFCIVLMWAGYRYLRFQNASVWLTCHKQECHLQITPMGWRKTKNVHMSRRQLVKAIPVKTTKEGRYVGVGDVSGIDHGDYKSRKQSKKKNKKNMSNYKGPDADGNYLSYALVFRDKADLQKQATEGEEEKVTEGRSRLDDALHKHTKHTEEAKRILDEDLVPDADIVDILKPFAEETEEGWRLIVRKFRIAQSKRRVRTMTQKVDSYVKRRRHKLVIKENAPPSWQGILFMIVGLIGLLLTILIGQFWEEPPMGGPRGPGVRRQSQPAFDHDVRKAKQEHAELTKSAQIPSRYEVRMQPSAKTSSTTRKRY